MKRKFNLLLLAVILLFAGCHEVTVGYLFTDEAAYSPNEMEITNIHQRLTELQQMLDAFVAEAGPLQNEYKQLNADYTAKNNALEELNATISPVEDSVSKVLDPVKDAEKIKKLKERLETELYPQQKELGEQVKVAESLLHQKELELQEVADRIGIQSSTVTSAEISSLKDRIKYNVPWTSSAMEGILGTEPLIYEIMAVQNENPGNAAKFREYLSVAGQGKLLVEQDFEAPEGRYVIDLKVSNEGRSKVFPKAFTFIVRIPKVN